MKNKILMISTFFISFVILIGSVNAECQELTCIYNDGVKQVPAKLVQYPSNGECKHDAFLMYNRDVLANDNPGWVKMNKIFVDTEGDSTRFDPDKNANFIACPNYIDFDFEGNFHFRDKIGLRTGWVKLHNSFSSAKTSQTKELSCKYAYGEKYYMLTQSKEGEHNFYFSDKDSDYINDGNWKLLNGATNNQKISFSNTKITNPDYGDSCGKADSSGWMKCSGSRPFESTTFNGFTECPKNYERAKNFERFYNYYLRNGSSIATDPDANPNGNLSKQYDTDLSDNNSVDSNGNKQAIIDDDVIFASGGKKCEYALASTDSNGKVTNGAKVAITLYYTDSDFKTIGSQGVNQIEYGFNISDLLENNKGYCPMNLYLESDETLGDIKFYLEENSKTTQKYVLLNEKGADGSNNDNKNYVEEPQNPCDLFDGETLKLIDDIMNIIRICVPILLVILGMTDFLRATFSDNEDNMKKDRERFIKRILAAIIVFIVPIFVNLILSIANKVWSDISPETCIK